MKNYLNKLGFTLIEGLISTVLIMILGIIVGFGITKLKHVNNYQKNNLKNEFFISSIYQYFNLYPDQIEEYLKSFEYTSSICNLDNLKNGTLYSFIDYPNVCIGIHHTFRNYIFIVYQKDQNNNLERYFSCRRIIKDTSY